MSTRETTFQPFAEPPTGVRWWVFALSCGTSWMLYLHRYSFALIKPKLKEQWDVDNVTLGAMDSAFQLAYAVFQVPGGLLADVLGPQFFLGSIIVGWSVFLGLHAWAPTVGAMYWVRFGFGTTQAGCYATLSKVTRSWFPRSIRTVLQGWIASFFGRIGGASSNLLYASVLVGWIGLAWQDALFVLAGAGILLGIVFAAVFRNTPREHPLVNEAERELIEREDPPPEAKPAARSGSRARRMLDLLSRLTPRSLANLLAFLVQQFSSTFADMIYLAWVPFFLYEEHGLEYLEMGFYSSLPLIGGACGGMFGGFLNDWMIARTGSRRFSRSGVGFFGKAIAAVLVIVALGIYDNPYAFCWILLFVKFFSDWSQPTVWGTVTDIGGRATGTVFGIVNLVGAIGGLVSPPVFGYIAERFNWPLVFSIVAGTYVLSACSWWLVNCEIPLLTEEEEEEEEE